MDSSIAFGNLGIGELALVVAALLLLLGVPNGFVRYQQAAWHAELRRRHYPPGRRITIRNSSA